MKRLRMELASMLLRGHCQRHLKRKLQLHEQWETDKIDGLLQKV